MSFLNRRSFLAKVGLGLIAFIPAASVLLRSAPRTIADETAPGESPPAEPKLPLSPVSTEVDSHYAAGILISGLDSDSELEIRTPYAGLETLILNPGTLAWEGLWVKDLPLQPGDKIVAWGDRLEGGKFSLEKYWVNPVNLRGTVASVVTSSPELQLVLNDSRSGSFSVVVDGRTEIADLSTNTSGKVLSFSELPVTFKPGLPAQIIGRKLQHGPVLATRIYLES